MDLDLVKSLKRTMGWLWGLSSLTLWDAVARFSAGHVWADDGHLEPCES